MKQTLILVMILIIIAVAAGFIYLQSNKNNSQNLTFVPTPTPSTSIPPSDLLQGGSSFADPNGVFAFLYPSDWVLDTGDPIHQRVYKTGPTQKGQTEMYDGVVLVFETVNLNGEDLSAWVDNKIEESTADGTLEITSPKTATSINNYPGFTYKARGLGESTYLVVQKDNNSDNAIVITYMVADPGNVGFQQEVNDILSTLQLLK